jgi:ATPase subunit of ABC transporter with duplicated ATPase domains
MKELNKTWPGGKQVIKDGWLSFYPGAKIGVLGSNGAGKSTLLKIMAGIDKEFSGEAWAAEGIKVGYLAQEPLLDNDLSVFDNIMLGVSEVKDALK